MTVVATRQDPHQATGMTPYGPNNIRELTNMQERLPSYDLAGFVSQIRRRFENAVKQGEKDIKCHSPCGFSNFAVRS